MGHHAADLTPAHDLLPARQDAADDADEPAGPVSLSLHVFQQELPPLLIVQALAAVPGGVHPRRAVQGVHRQAGIVGNGRQAGGLHDGPGLDPGVFLKGGAGLLRLQVHPHVGLGDDLHPELGQNLPHFLHLFLVVAGQDCSHFPSPSMTAFWIACS